MKLTIYHGSDKPLVAIGRNQCNALDFAFRYPGWHAFRQDRSTKRAIYRLADKGVLLIAGDQFRINWGE